MVPRTQVVDSDGCSIAYQVLGEGPDLLFVPGFLSHLDMQWSDPWFAAALRRLASFSRLIMFDHRGIGLSDPAVGIPGLEQRVRDMTAVLDAVGSKRAALLGHCNGGPASVLFATMNPGRVSSMVICSSFAKGRPDGDCPGALSDVALQLARDAVGHWGEGRSLRLFTGSTAGGRWHERMYGSFERASASPAMARAGFESTLEIDVTDLLPDVRVPTLVMHCTDDFMSVEAARYIADEIPGARFVEIDGPDHVPFAGQRSGEFLDHIEPFLTGRRSSRRSADRVQSILFTDVVGSTEHASRLGDVAWRDLMQAHHEVVLEQVEAFNGRQVKSTGDGVLAVFVAAEDGVRAANAIQRDVRELGLEVRAGLHTGSCELIDDDVVGLSVNVAGRIAALAGPGELFVSDAVRKRLAGTDVAFDPRGSRELKGVPGRWRIFSADAVRGPLGCAPAWAEGAVSLQDMRSRNQVVVRLARTAPWLTRTATRLVSRPPTFARRPTHTETRV